MKVACAVCGDPVDTRKRGWYFQVIGWREKGDGRNLAPREESNTGQVMHRGCYTRGTQGSLAEID